MQKGFILLNCDLGAEEYIVDELKQMQNISNAYLTFGAYDVIAEIQCENQEEFEKAIGKNQKTFSSGKYNDTKCTNSRIIVI